MGKLARRLYKEISEGFVEAEDELIALQLLYETRITKLIERHETIQHEDTIVPLHLNLINGEINLKEFQAKEIRVREQQVIIQKLEETPEDQRTSALAKEINRHITAFQELFKDFEQTRLDIKKRVSEKLIETNPFFAYLYSNKLTNIEDIDKRISRSISRVFRRSIMEKTTFVDDPFLKKWVSRVQGALRSALSSIRLYSDSIMYSQPDTLDIFQKGLGLSNFLNEKLAQGYLDLPQAKLTITNLYGILRQTSQVINQIKLATRGKLIKIEAQQGGHFYEEDDDDEDLNIETTPTETESLEEAQEKFKTEMLKKVDSESPEITNLTTRIREQSNKLNDTLNQYKGVNIEQIPHQARKKFWAKLYRSLRESGFQPKEITTLLKAGGDLLDDALSGKLPLPNTVFMTMLEVSEQQGLDFRKEFKKYLKDESEDKLNDKGN